MRNNGKDNKIDPRVKDVLKLLGVGTLLLVGLVMPGPVAVLVKAYEKDRIERDKKEWEKYNLWRLRQVIKRLKKQKVVEIKNGIVSITEKGRQRLLKFNLEELEIKRKTDGRWRLIIYDIANLRKPQRELFRETLKRLKFFRLQESVYLTPFVCDEEIEYLRQLFDIDNEVQVLKVSGLENEQEYKRYFGI